MPARKRSPRTGATRAAESASADAEAERDLIKALQGGDEAAFVTLMRRYQRPLYRLAYRYVRSEADATDIAQRAFVRAHRSIGSFRGESSLRTWLYRITINLSLNHLRDRKREQVRDIAEDELPEVAVGPARLITAEQRAQLRDAIDMLPNKQRMVLELRVYDELPFREVAELTNCSENAAKVNFHHAVKKLRELLAGGDES